jgi:hypothetical protein
METISGYQEYKELLALVQEVYEPERRPNDTDEEYAIWQILTDLGRAMFDIEGSAWEHAFLNSLGEDWDADMEHVTDDVRLTPTSQVVNCPLPGGGSVSIAVNITVGGADGEAVAG